MKRIVSLFLFSFAFVFVVKAQLPQNVPTTGLIAFYPFNGNVNNAASIQHNGLATAAVLATDRGGNIGSAYSLNGTNASLTIPSSVMSAAGASFTVSLWVKPDTINRSNQPAEIISDKNSSGWLHKFRLGLGSIAGGYAADSVHYDAIIASGVIPKISGPYPHNELWTHYVMVYETANNGTFMLYHNGILFSTRTNVGFVSGGRQINIGRAIYPGAPSGGFFYKGLVDDVGIWNRALTTQEITNLYNVCAFLPVSSPLNATVNFGDSAQFSVQASGSGLNYAWQQNTGSGFTNIPPSSGFGGVNTSNLTVYNIQHAQNNYQYRCVVSDTACLIYSNPATLSVICPAQVVSHPQNATSFIAGMASFTVAASAGSNFQWQRLGSTGFINLSNFGQYSGVTSATLTVSNLSFTNNGELYRCIISSNQLCADTSQTALLEVQCLTQITQGPANVQTTTGNTATFNVAAGSSTSFQWQVQSFSNFVNLSNSTKYTGVNTSTLSVLNSELADDGLTFRCIVTALGCNDTSQTALLQVSCADLVTLQPRDTSAIVGGSAMFAVQLIPGANYQWYRNSGFAFVPIIDDNQYSGSISHQLFINNLTLANHNSSFACVVSRSGCADTSNIALLSVINNVSVRELPIETLKLYPNPANDQLTLVLDGGWKEQTVQILDLYGRVHYSSLLGEGKHHILLQEWPAGTYIVRAGQQSLRFVVLP